MKSRKYVNEHFPPFVADGEEKYIGAVNKSGTGAILIGYDDRISIDYFGEYRKGYYLENHTIIDALTDMWRHRNACEE